MFNIQKIIDEAKGFIASHPDFQAAAVELENVAVKLADEAVRAGITAALGTGLPAQVADMALDGIEKLIEDKLGFTAPVAPAAPVKPAPAPATLTAAASRFLRR